MVKPTKSVRLDVNIWFNERTGHIHIAAANAFISTVSNDPASKRYHPNLFRKAQTTTLSRSRLSSTGEDERERLTCA
jgi:hypothetical protein